MSGPEQIPQLPQELKRVLELGGDRLLNVKRTNGEMEGDWHLVGNPYPLENEWFVEVTKNRTPEEIAKGKMGSIVKRIPVADLLSWNP